jgi:hypothetical protein
VTDDSLAVIAKNGYSLFDQKGDHVLIFSDNSKCIIRTFQAIPSFPKKGEEEQWYIQDKEATWHIGEETLHEWYKTKQVPAVTIKIIDEEKDALGNIIFSESMTLTFYIGEDESGLILWQYVGDPDYEEYFKFMKVDEAGIFRESGDIRSIVRANSFSANIPPEHSNIDVEMPQESEVPVDVQRELSPRFDAIRELLQPGMQLYTINKEGVK